MIRQKQPKKKRRTDRDEIYRNKASRERVGSRWKTLSKKLKSCVVNHGSFGLTVLVLFDGNLLVLERALDRLGVREDLVELFESAALYHYSDGVHQQHDMRSGLTGTSKGEKEKAG